jgi:transposase
MAKHRPHYRAPFTFQLALEAAKGGQTINELASVHGGQPTQVSGRKRPLLEAGSAVFSCAGARPPERPRNGRTNSTSTCAASRGTWRA